MHDDIEVRNFVLKAQTPQHSPDLQDRIIAAAMASGHEKQHAMVAQVKQGRSFKEWWQDFGYVHGQKMAAVAILLAVAVIIFDPAGKATQSYIEEKQIVEAERYTVDGIPLLVDVALMEEPDLHMEEVVLFSGQG